MRTRGLPGRTQKFTIHSTLTNAEGEREPYVYGFYLHLAWVPSGIRITNVNGVLRPVHYTPRLDYVDLTVARAQAHDIRAVTELMCQEAYALLRSGVWDIDKLVKEWVMRRFEPEGPCPELGGIVKSPIDAAARFIQKRRIRWES